MAIYRGGIPGWPTIHGRGPISSPFITRGIWPRWNGANCHWIWEVNRGCGLRRRDNPKPRSNAKACTGGVYRKCNNGSASLFVALVSCAFNFRTVYAGHIDSRSPNNRNIINPLRDEYDVNLFVAARAPISNTGL